MFLKTQSLEKQMCYFERLVQLFHKCVKEDHHGAYLIMVNMHTPFLTMLFLLAQRGFVASVRVCNPHNQLVRVSPSSASTYSLQRSTSVIFDQPVSTCKAGLKCIQFCKISCAHCTFMVVSDLHVSCECANFFVDLPIQSVYNKNICIVYHCLYHYINDFCLHACTYINPMFLYLGIL